MRMDWKERDQMEELHSRMKKLLWGRGLFSFSFHLSLNPFTPDQHPYPMEKYSILNYLISIHHSQQQFLLLLHLIHLHPSILPLLILVSPISSMVHSLLIHLLVPLNIRPIAISLRLSPGTVDSLIESFWLQLSHLHCSYSIEWLLNGGGGNEALFPFPDSHNKQVNSLQETIFIVWRQIVRSRIGRRRRRGRLLKQL